MTFTSRKIRGFSLLEMMIVIGIGMTVAGISVMALMPMLNENHVDQAYDTALSVMRNYRNLAITQSNRYIITFTTPGTITVQLWGYDGGHLHAATRRDLRGAIHIPGSGSGYIRHGRDRHRL
jgi:Tfp pilus assembly protein FimT